VVDKIVVATMTFIDVYDNLRELIQGNSVYLNRILDEFGGAKEDFLFFFAITDVVLCEYSLGNGQQVCDAHEKETY